MIESYCFLLFFLFIHMLSFILTFLPYKYIIHFVVLGGNNEV